MILDQQAHFHHTPSTEMIDYDAPIKPKPQGPTVIKNVLEEIEMSQWELL